MKPVEIKYKRQQYFSKRLYIRFIKDCIKIEINNYLRNKQNDIF